MTSGILQLHLQRNPQPSTRRRVYDPTYVRTLFDGIARRYDLLNRLLSLGFDIGWRRSIVTALRQSRHRRILDVATGTADVAIATARLCPEYITGLDPSLSMLSYGRQKVARRRLDHLITLQEGSAEHLPFPDASFDAVTVAFGVRNFSDLHAGLCEIRRVLTPGGMAVILEFSTPRSRVMNAVYRWYASTVIPLVGRVVSRRSEAYRYLPATIAEFPSGSTFVDLLHAAGFGSCDALPLSFGIVTRYTARKYTAPE